MACNAYDSVNSLYVGVHCLDNFDKGNACCSVQMLFLFWERVCLWSPGGLELESSCLFLLSDGIGSSQAPSHPAVIFKKKMFSICIWLNSWMSRTHVQKASFSCLWIFCSLHAISMGVINSLGSSTSSELIFSASYSWLFWLVQSSVRRQRDRVGQSTRCRVLRKVLRTTELVS